MFKFDAFFKSAPRPGVSGLLVGLRLNFTEAQAGRLTVEAAAAAVS
jgi:hypothetical protein